MKPENAIEVHNITKSFKIYPDKGNTLKERAIYSYRRKYEKREVLKGISFEVKKGEAIGLIGHNGCGKSTTLKLLTRIMYPDSGTIEMKGRVSSLIELGAGFHPDMSGRENIYINASIFGLTKKEIDARLDDIIRFSELEEFIDNPVRTYSSGMYMRLAFSVAINVDADILLIDEILAVGDAGFQTKCFNKLKEIKANGTTIVIVSHSLGQIEQICERSYWIDKGLIVVSGPPKEVHPQYMDYMAKERIERTKAEEVQKENAEKKAQGEAENKDGEKDEAAGKEAALSAPEVKSRWGNGFARIEKITLLDSEGNENTAFISDSGMTIRIKYHVFQEVKDAIFGIGIFRVDGVHCYGTNTRLDMIDHFDLTEDGTVDFVIDKLLLLPGKYTLDVAIESGVDSAVDYYTKAKVFETFAKINDVGVSRISHTWKFEV